MTKKMLVFFSGIISIILLGINYLGVYNVCLNKFECIEVLYQSMMVLFPIIPLFLFSLITYKMREDIFQTWWKFARVWIPFSMLAILLSPSYTNNWIFPIEKGTVAFFSSALFVIISVSILGYHYYKLKKANK